MPSNLVEIRHNNGTCLVRAGVANTVNVARGDDKWMVEVRIDGKDLAFNFDDESTAKSVAREIMGCQ